MLHIVPDLYKLLTGVRYFLYDYDDCLAPDSNDDVRQVWYDDLVIEFNLPREEIIRLNTLYFGKYGCSATGFAKHHGRTKKWVNSFYAKRATESGAVFVSRHQPSSLLAEHFGIIHAKNIKQGIFTQGHPNHYKPGVRHIGLAPYIARNMHFNRLNMRESKRTEAPYVKILKLLDARPEEVIMFEDTVENLDPLFGLGIRAVLVGRRHQSPESAHIPFRFPTMLDAHQTLQPYYGN